MQNTNRNMLEKLPFHQKQKIFDIWNWHIKTVGKHSFSKIHRQSFSILTYCLHYQILDKNACGTSLNSNQVLIDHYTGIMAETAFIYDIIVLLKQNRIKQYILTLCRFGLQTLEIAVRIIL